MKVFRISLQIIVSSLFVGWGTASLVFLALRIAPGDPTDLLFDQQSNSSSQNELRQTLRRELALDLTPLKQYERFLKNSIRLDWGQSIVKKERVIDLIFQHLESTLLLTLLASILANSIALLLGAWAATDATKLGSRVLFWFSCISQSIPLFWLGPLLVIAFSLRWPWLPAGGFDQASSLVLPSFSLALGMSAVLGRSYEVALRTTLSSDYARTARSKGLGMRSVILFHVLPNALPPVLIIASLQLGNIIAGAIITETVFDIPGIGTLLYEAISGRDIPVVQGVILFIAIAVGFINAIADQATRRLTPQGEI